MAILAVAWWRRSSAGRQLGLVGLPLALAGLLLSLGVAHQTLGRPGRVRLEAQARQQWSELWEESEAIADEVVGSLPETLTSEADRKQAFAILHRLTVVGGPSPLTLLVLDANGEPAAWAGPGLLHDLEGADLPLSGRTQKVGFSAVTLLVVRPLTTGIRPWRVVVGQSLPTDRLPFELTPGWSVEATHWSVADARSPVAAKTLSVAIDDTPILLVDLPVEDIGAWHSLARDGSRRLAWGLIGLALISLGVTRAVRTLAARQRPPVAFLWITGAAAAFSWAMALNLGPGVAAALGLATAVAVFGLLSPGRRISSAWISAAWSAIAVGGAIVLPRLAFWSGASPDLGNELLAVPEILAGRLALFGLAIGLLALARGRLQTAPGSGWLVAGFSLLLIAAATHDLTAAALPAVVLGGAAIGAWSAAEARRHQPTHLVVLALAAALIAGAGWETGHRQVLKEDLRTVLLPGMAPPSDAEAIELSAELADFFDQIRLEDLFAGDPGAAESRDLAYSLWRRSPLARRGILSALVVTPAEAPVSSFSFGLPPLRDGLADWSPDQWRRLVLPGWPERPLQGEGRLNYDDGPWATVGYWLLLRPGFRLQTPAGGDLAVDLVRGDPATRPPAESALRPARYALYDPDGRPLIVPWAEAPWLTTDGFGATEPVMPTPDGQAWTFQQTANDGIEVIFLRVVTPGAALIRVGNHVVAIAAVLAILLLVALLVSLPRAAVRSFLGRTLRSYSKRLMIIFTGLVLVPLMLLNIVLLREFERRLERQNQAAGEAALDTAQRILGNYVLSIEPGFGIDTALNDEVLSWLSRLTGHEVNLYWGGDLYASSRQGLFTAGVLPNRIPGEIYSRLSLLGYRLSTRTNRAGGTAYLEIYAPLRVPGAPAQERLILSMPLLAQQEEVAAEIARLRSAGMLVTSVLFMLLVAVGTHLAYRFTRPLQELVAGTQRIADGATSIDLTPSDLELAALVEAVDKMAGRLAEGRANLLREKALVDRVVQNITSAVVSVDADGLVQMHNRIAADFLGVGKGDSLMVALQSNPALERVAAFVGGVGGERTESTTVRLEVAEKAVKEWSLIWVPLPRAVDPWALLVVEDVTEVLRSQRLEAWEEMARMIAHEVKNPLTPIQLSTEHMQEVWRRQPENFGSVLTSCTRNILRQVDTLRQIAGEFSVYSQVPRFEPRPEDLVARLRESVEAYESAAIQGVQVTFVSDLAELSLRFDAHLLGRAVRNLLENAVRATPESGEVVVALGIDGDEVRISVADTGPGTPADTLQRIFDPHFSTHAQTGGSGLGLPIARQVAEQHGGTISARNRRQGGLEVTIRLPLDRG